MVPAGPPGARWLDECADYCQRRGYTVLSVVPADTVGWGAAMEAWLKGEVDVLVVARESHIPPDRVPRVEIVAREEPHRRRPGDRPRRSENGTRPG
jgi:hypothetical protein